MEQKAFTNMQEQNVEDRLLAHDLRNALSSILMYAQILEASLSKLSLKDEEKTARLISHSVREMNTMINTRFGTNETPQAPL